MFIEYYEGKGAIILREQVVMNNSLVSMLDGVKKVIEERSVCPELSMLRG